MRKAILSLCFAMATVFGVGAAAAHHSFAAFFDNQKTRTVTGAVMKFQFTNPHALIEMKVKAEGGETEIWRIETNAPVLLRRLGWTRDSVKPGDMITVVGWVARDGSNYLRMQRATNEKGEPIGRPMGAGDQT